MHKMFSCLQSLSLTLQDVAQKVRFYGFAFAKALAGINRCQPLIIPPEVWLGIGFPSQNKPHSHRIAGCGRSICFRCRTVNCILVPGGVTGGKLR
jgi:hypothetical protein